MIISHKHKFIFIKTYKTAGTSIEAFLSRHCADDDVFTPIIPPIATHRPRNFRGAWNPLRELVTTRGEDAGRLVRDLLGLHRFYNHLPARRAAARVPCRWWRDYFKFCVERNPWDKTISHYHMTRASTGGDLSLDEYLSRGNLCLNHFQYTDVQGRVMVDRIVKYESLGAELSEIFADLGIPFSGELDVRAKKEHRTDRRRYQEVFSEQQRLLVEREFSKEIELHQYSY